MASNPAHSTLNVADVCFKFSIKLSFTMNDKILEERTIGLRLLKNCCEIQASLANTSKDRTNRRRNSSK